MLRDFIQKINKFPIWIKHIIFIELKDDFEKKYLEKYFSGIKTEDMFQLFSPELTFLGKKAIKEGVLDSALTEFLSSVDQGLNIVDISVRNEWNLSRTAKYFVESLNSDLIEQPESQIIKGTALYLNGNIRLGEYFVNLNKLSIEQLDEALRTQQYIEKSSNTKLAIAEILINLDFISKEETEGILLLKSECDKDFSLNDSPENLFIKKKDENEEITILKAEVQRLKTENKQLKEQLISVLKVEK